MSLLQVNTIRNRSGDGAPLFDRGISVTGVITSTSIKVSSVGIGSTEVISSSFQLKNITSIDSTTLSTLEIALEAAPNNFNSLYIGGGGISTFTGNVYAAGITTVNNDLYVNGTLFSSLSGASLSSLSIGSTQVISSSRELQNITSLDSVTTATIESAIVNTPNIFNDLVITGISTFTNGPILVGSGTSTGTTNQRLQVTGGAYVSGNVGVGTTNPTSKLTVIGDALITGTLSALNFSGITTYSDNAGIATYATNAGIATYATNAGIATYATNAGIATNVIGGIGSISQLRVSGISTFIGVTEFKNIVFAEQDLFVTDYFTANQVAIGTLTNIADVTSKNFGKTLNIGNDLVMFHLNQPSQTKRSNWIISDEYDLLLGTKSEGSTNLYSALIGIQTGNDINPGNTADVYVGYGTEGAKLTTTGYGVSVTGSLTATNSIGIGTTNPTSKLTVVGDVLVSGVVTATSFSGTATSTTNIPNLSGDITSTNTATTLATVNSNVGTFGGTDAIPVVTVNAKGLVTGISTVAPNNGTLTLAVSGTGLSGSASFTANQSGVSTFTIDSNATSANTNSTIVARDGSGGFVAGIITATSFSGTATSTTNIPNLSGAITSNNTTTSLGSFTSTNLAAALTDETGSGSAVFATSPTLVTPILGAASATSIVVSSGSTFTNGPILVGSGTSTGTDSQPLQVTGGAYVSGNVGVGTTIPTSPLEVSQNTTGTHDLTITNLNTGNNITKASRIRFRLTDSIGTKKDVAYISAHTYNLDSSAGNYLSFFTRTVDATPTEKMRLDKDGNLVLGSSFTPTGTASQPLQVSGGAYVSGSVGIGTINPIYGVHIQGTSIAEIGFTATGTGGDNFRVGSGSIAAGFDGLRVYDVNASAERLRVDSSGNIVINSTSATGTASQPLQVTGGAYVSGSVGIGTTNPTSALTVSGDGSFTGVVTATGGFISVGNTTPIQISLIGNQLTFTAVGIGSTTLTLS